MRLFFNFMHAYPKGAPKVAPLIFLSKSEISQQFDDCLFLVLEMHNVW